MILEYTAQHKEILKEEQSEDIYADFVKFIVSTFLIEGEEFVTAIYVDSALFLVFDDYGTDGDITFCITILDITGLSDLPPEQEYQVKPILWMRCISVEYRDILIEKIRRTELSPF